MTRRYRHTATEYLPQPPRTHTVTVRAKVVVPVLHAFFIGLAVAVLAVVVVGWIGPRRFGLEGRQLREAMGSWASSCGGVAWCASTIAFILQERPQRERVTVEELPEPGPEPSRPEVRSRIIAYEDPGGKRQRHFELPVSDDKMRRVAQAVLWQGKNFSRPVLCGELGILTQGEYRKLAASLTAGRMLVLMADNHHELLAAGRRMLRRFL
uniref:Uncharacterized protein n=1 Tax=viral metagenome TaxID=1070528 RepID=A0A6M3LSI3_9ZZZZ